MGTIGRRRLLESAGVLLAAGGIPSGGIAAPAAEPNPGKPLQLADFEPRSMLHVPETKVERSRYPLIDVHTHLSRVAKNTHGVGIGEVMQYSAPVEAVLPLMDRKNIRIMVNLTGSDRSDPVIPPKKHFVHRDANGDWQPDDPSNTETVDLWNNPSETLGL